MCYLCTTSSSTCGLTGFLPRTFRRWNALFQLCWSNWLGSTCLPGLGSSQHQRACLGPRKSEITHVKISTFFYTRDHFSSPLRFFLSLGKQGKKEKNSYFLLLLHRNREEKWSCIKSPFWTPFQLQKCDLRKKKPAKIFWVFRIQFNEVVLNPEEKFLFFPVSPKTKKIGAGKKSDPV